MCIPVFRLMRAVLLCLMLLLLLQEHLAAMDADDAPEELELAALEHLYEPVLFDHLLHSDIADCAHCHHHTTGTGPLGESCSRCHAEDQEAETVSCSDCHSTDPFSAEELAARRGANVYHIDRPGLKGAYHLNCLGCHQEEGGPTGCRDCHAMTAAGEDFFSHPAAPASIPQAGKEHQQGDQP